MTDYNPERSFGFLLYDAARLLRRDFDRRARSLGLTRAQWSVLAHLKRNEGSKQAAVADTLELEPITLAYDEMGKKVAAADYLIAVQYFQLLARQIAEFMKEYDVLLTPTLGSPPLPLGSFAPTPEDPLVLGVASAFVPFTPICNATGQPAMSVPLYWNTEGLPIGTHFIGRYGDEATLYRLASQLEQARPWANRRPPASA